MPETGLTHNSVASGLSPLVIYGTLTNNKISNLFTASLKYVVVIFPRSVWNLFQLVFENKINTFAHFSATLRSQISKWCVIISV